MSKDTIIVDGQTYFSPKAIMKHVNSVIANSLHLNRRVARPAVEQIQEAPPAAPRIIRRRGRPARVPAQHVAHVDQAPQNGIGQ